MRLALVAFVILPWLSLGATLWVVAAARAAEAPPPPVQIERAIRAIAVEAGKPMFLGVLLIKGGLIIFYSTFSRRPSSCL
jgi:hypothetical protein